LLFCLFTCPGFGTRLHGASYVVGWGNNYAGETQAPADLTNAIAVSTGGSFTLALKTNGTVVGWGNNSLGQTSIPAGLSNVAAIAAGAEHSLALKSDGTIVAWGADNFGQSTVPSGLDNVVAIAAGNQHSLVLKADGTVYAWGYNSYGETNIPKGLSNVVAISTYQLHNLALKSDGTVVVWGDDPDWNAPPPGLSNVVAVSAGDWHNLALKSDGTVVAWGRSNTYGQQNVPAGLSNVVAIAVGSSHSLALKNDGTVVGWGYDLASTIPRGLTNVTAISAGGSRSIALNDGSPVILKDPSSQTLYSGNGFYFSAQATGLPPLSFQWRWNGTDLPGATNSWYWPTNLQVADSGEYQLVVSDLLGSVVSAPGILTVTSTLPIITKQPTNLVVMPGANPTFSIAVDGSQPFQFQWRFQGQAISGATDSTLILNGVHLSNRGQYDVVVTNPNGSVTSTSVSLSVLPILAWGYYGLVPTYLPLDSTNLVAIATYGGHSLALKSDGTLVAWGGYWWESSRCSTRAYWSGGHSSGWRTQPGVEV
jgi:alpha-tubulin suppressor-like RCC1 family protein